MKRILSSLLLLACASFVIAQDSEVVVTGPSVTFYEAANYNGGSITLRPGDSVQNLAGVNFYQGRGANDHISSIRIQGAVEVLVFEDARFGGNVLRLVDSVRNLADRRLPLNVSGTWNDRISSIQVNALRRGPREPAPDVLVKRLYLEVLAREVDPEGGAFCRDLIVNQGWTEPMVREHLLKSDEYRKEGVNRIITRAYRDVLKRAPDPDGLKAYYSLVLDKGWSEEQVRNALRQSQEYKDRDKNGGGPPPRPDKR